MDHSSSGTGLGPAALSLFVALSPVWMVLTLLLLLHWTSTFYSHSALFDLVLHELQSILKYLSALRWQMLHYRPWPYKELEVSLSARNSEIGPGRRFCPARPPQQMIRLCTTFCENDSIVKSRTVAEYFFPSTWYKGRLKLSEILASTRKMWITRRSATGF